MYELFCWPATPQADRIIPNSRIKSAFSFSPFSVVFAFDFWFPTSGNTCCNITVKKSGAPLPWPLVFSPLFPKGTIVIGRHGE